MSANHLKTVYVLISGISDSSILFIKIFPYSTPLTLKIKPAFLSNTILSPFSVVISYLSLSKSFIFHLKTNLNSFLREKSFVKYE